MGLGTVRVSVRAKGGLGFMYFSSNLLQLKVRPGGGFGKNKSSEDDFQFFPQNATIKSRKYWFSEAHFCKAKISKSLYIR